MSPNLIPITIIQSDPSMIFSDQGALTQLIQLYHRFHRVLSQPQLRALPARAELINIHHLMVELKKHKPNF
jgi:hypothetical protein